MTGATPGGKNWKPWFESFDDASFGLGARDDSVSSECDSSTHWRSDTRRHVLGKKGRLAGMTVRGGFSFPIRVGLLVGKEGRLWLLGLKRRILLEDHSGHRHSLHLLEVIQARYFVLLAPDPAERLSALQQAQASIDEALVILMEHIHILSMREHQFLKQAELPEILRHSTHYVLRQVALRLSPGLPEVPEHAGLLDAHAFFEESLRRKAW